MKFNLSSLKLLNDPRNLSSTTQSVVFFVICVIIVLLFLLWLRVFKPRREGFYSENTTPEKSIKKLIGDFL
jgi:RsiW-degrading membrane proteinase PrsW (M82 family)